MVKKSYQYNTYTQPIGYEMVYSSHSENGYEQAIEVHKKITERAVYYSKKIHRKKD